MTKRAEVNFANWKSIVGLADSFPFIAPIEPTEFQKRFYAPPHRLPVLEKALLRVGASSRLVLAIDHGHGCTTLHNYFIQSLHESAMMRRLLPMPLHIGREFWTSDAELDVDEVVKKAMLDGLITYDWKVVLDSSEYKQLLNVWDEDESGHKERSAQLVALRRQLDAAKDSHKRLDWSDLARRGPDLTGPCRDCVGQLREFRLQPVLFVDASMEPLGEAPDQVLESGLQRLGKAVHNMATKVFSRPTLRASSCSSPGKT